MQQKPWLGFACGDTSDFDISDGGSMPLEVFEHDVHSSGRKQDRPGCPTLSRIQFAWPK